ncbi:titin homolog [Lytechinus variegatus]|uniref:titin homolog n=1 Tax=Lytechinus variegatus TaxID=7654 RepID=UPI001BB2A33D|nr:titin homolog [Lytechinus variegatus]
MEGTAFDDDRPIYVGQVPPELDTADQPCTPSDIQVPVENIHGYHVEDASETGQVPPEFDNAAKPCTLTDIQVPVEKPDGYHVEDASETEHKREEEISLPIANLMSCEKQSDDQHSVDAHQNMDSSQGLVRGVTDNELWDTESIDFTLDSSCAWVDECSDDDFDQEIRVGHELKSLDSSPQIADLKSKCELAVECEDSSLGESGKAECIPEVTTAKRKLDSVSSSVTSVTEHLSRYGAVPGDDLERTCDAHAKTSCELRDLNFENNEAFTKLEHQRLSESEITYDHNVSEDGKTECQSMDASEGEDLERTCDAFAKTAFGLRDLNVEKNEAFTNLGHQRLSESEIPNDHNVSEKGKTERQIIDASEGNDNSLKTRRKTRRKKNGYMIIRKSTRKSKTPSKSVARCKDSKTMCEDVEWDKEENSLSTSKQASLESRTKIDCDRDEGSIQHEMNCFECEEVGIGPVHRKERRPALMNEDGHGENLYGNAVPEIDDKDCEPVSSQIYIGAPIFPLLDATGRCNESIYQNVEDISEAGEGDQLNVDDTLRERIDLAIPVLKGSHEREKLTAKEDQFKETDMNEPCVEANSPCHDVLKMSKRQRRSPRSSQKQNEIILLSNEQGESDNLREEKALIRTQRGSRRVCKRPRKQRQFETAKDVIDKRDKPSSNASVETSPETVPELVPEKKEVPESNENVDGPTPPEKRPIYRARRRRANSKKSASDMIRDLTAASESALKRVSESTSPPSPKENQESVQADQMVGSKKRRGRPPKARPTRKRKFQECSLECDDDPVKTSDEPNQSRDSNPGQNIDMIRQEYASHDEDSGVDDDELINPVLTPDSKTKDLPPAFSISDVVWAQDPKDKLRWPSVVIEVAGENLSRRVYTVFKTHQTKEQYFQAKSSRYLKPYNCREKEEYLEKGKGVTDFHTAVQIANDFIMKIGLGKVNSHEDFFKPSEAYPDSPPPSPCDLSPSSPLLRVGHNIQEDSLNYSRTSHCTIDDIDDDKDEEEQSLKDRLSIDRNIFHRDPKEMTKLKRKWQRKEKRLLSLMRSQEAMEYLVSIQRGKVASLRHQWFLSNKPIDKGRLLRGSFGALISEEKRHEIMKHLKDVLTIEESLKSSHQYIMDVALPEALNFAYQKVNKVGEEEAEVLVHTDGLQVARDLDIG